MPEYPAPGVYVEEMQTGSKPITGVSTSTAGMVGVTERGPVNTPILVTSYGDFRRWFGDTLNIGDFSNNGDAHCYLPHAVQGFFNNGGKRLYVTRVLDTNGPQHASTHLFDRGALSSANTVLLRGIDEQTSTAADSPLLYVLDASDIDPNEWIRIGSGSNADYRQVADVGDATHVSLNFPLSFAHDAEDQVVQFDGNPAPGYGNGFTLVEDVEAAASTLLLQGAAHDHIEALKGAAKPLLEIGGENGEYHFAAEVTDIAEAQARVRLCSPLALTHPAGATAVPIQVGVVGPNRRFYALRQETGARLGYIIKN